MWFIISLYIYLGYADAVEGLWLQLLSDVRNRVCYDHGPPVKCVLHSLEEERDTSHDSTWNWWKASSNSKSKNTHLEQLNQSTQSFDRGLGHGPLHRHVHVHGGFDDGADAVCIQDALRGRDTWREDVREDDEVSFVWSVYHEMSFFEDNQCILGVVL